MAKKVMSRAWEIYRTLQGGDRIARMSVAMKMAWAEIKKAIAKVRKTFDSIEAYEANYYAKGIKNNVAYVVKDGIWLRADMTVTAKKGITAVKRFASALEGIKRFEGWVDGMIEDWTNFVKYIRERDSYSDWGKVIMDGSYGIEDGKIPRFVKRAEHGQWSYAIESVDENEYYIMLNISETCH